MSDIHIMVMLSRERNQSGVLKLIRDGNVLAEYEALGRGSVGSGDTQLQVNGNTPTGEYEASQVVSTAEWSQSSYGPNGAIRLKPVSGNAQIAVDVLGRSGLLIHGGSPAGSNYWRKTQQSSDLRATLGCIRLSNDNMLDLISRLHLQTMDAKHNRSVDLKVKVTVNDYDMSLSRP